MKDTSPFAAAKGVAKAGRADPAKTERANAAPAKRGRPSPEGGSEKEPGKPPQKGPFGASRENSRISGERSLARRETPGMRKLVLAAELGKKGEYAEAMKLLRQLISETDAPPEAWLFLGRSLHALREYSRALAAFNDYIRQRPESGQGYLFAGRSCLALGLPYKAVPFLRKALENSPGDSATKALLGTAYLKSKHSQAAVSMLEEAALAAPADKRIYRAYLNALMVRGIRLCGLEDCELGLQMLRFVLENAAAAGYPESPLLRLQLGRAARETGRLAEALEHFTAALKLTDDRRIRWSRASILMAMGKNAEARQEIERIRSAGADVPELPWNSELVDLFMIRSFIEAGEWRSAVEACRDWLRKRETAEDPRAKRDRPTIRALYAEALRNLHKYEAAHNHLQRALEEAPGETEFWYADMLVSWEGKDFKSLKRAIRAAAKLGGDPDMVRRFSILCEARTSEDAPAAVALLQNAIRSLGPEPELMSALGEAYLKTGLLEEAQSWFKKARSLKEGCESAWLGEIAAVEAILVQGAADGAASSKNPAAACLAALYRAYLDRWPDNASIRREWALFLVKTFEYAEAAEELERLLAWEPGNPSLRRVLAYAYRKTGRFREAAVFLKALLKEKPKDLGLLLEYSGCLERAGAERYAVAVLEKAGELFENSAEIALALGVLNYRQKKLEKAFDCLRKAAGLDKKDPRPYEWMAIIARKNRDGNSGYYEKEAQKRRKFKK